MGDTILNTGTLSTGYSENRRMRRNNRYYFRKTEYLKHPVDKYYLSLDKIFVVIVGATTRNPFRRHRL